MRTKGLILILSVVCGILTSSLGQGSVIQWQKSLGGSLGEYPSSIQQVNDGGYIMTGWTNSPNNGDVTGNHGGIDYWIVKIDSAGIIQWQKCLGGNNLDWATDIKQTDDSGYIVAGYSISTYYNGSGSRDYWILKLDSVGDIQWQKLLGGSRDDLASSVQQTYDRGYIVSGSSYSMDGVVTGNHGGSADYWIVKLDSAGVIQWEKSLGGSLEDIASSIQQTVDGGYVVAGSSYSNTGDVTGNHGSADGWIVKLDSAGVIQWQKSLGGTGLDKVLSMQQTLDNGFVLAGNSTSTFVNGNSIGNHGNADYWVLKIDSTGIIQWQKCLGGSDFDYAKSIQQTVDGGYIVAGYTRSTNGNVTGNHGGEDYWIVKLDSAGGIQGEKTLGGSLEDEAFSVEQTVDGGYIIAGESTSNDGDVTGNHGANDFWVVKLSSCMALTPTLTASGPTAICRGDSITLTSSSPTGNVWSDGFTGQSRTVFGYPVAHTYSVTVSDGLCSATPPGITVTQAPTPSAYIFLGATNLGGSLPLCQGDTVTLESNIGNGNTWSTGDTAQSITITTGGTYVLIETNGQCFDKDSVVVTVYPLPPTPYITTSGPTSLCQGTSVTLSSSSTTGNRWSNGSNSQSINVSSAGTYSVVVSNGYCAIESASIHVSVNVTPSAQICLVSVDSSTYQNEIIWEKPAILSIDSFFIYKEGSTSGIYNKIGAVGVHDFSTYIDLASSPQQRADRYRITVLDTCGLESSFSSSHKTIHLSINQGINNSYNLIWDAYEGLFFGTYYIMRGSNPNNLITIDSVQSSLLSYTDINPPAGSIYYAVEIRKPVACNPTARIATATYSSSRSNLKDNINTAVSEPDSRFGSISLSPNPVHDNLNIQFYLAKSAPTTITIYDLTGRAVKVLSNSNLTEGIHTIKWDLNDDNGKANSGIYFIRIESEGYYQAKRIIVM